MLLTIRFNESTTTLKLEGTWGRLQKFIFVFAPFMPSPGVQFFMFSSSSHVAKTSNNNQTKHLLIKWITLIKPLKTTRYTGYWVLVLEWNKYCKNIFLLSQLYSEIKTIFPRCIAQCMSTHTEVIFTVFRTKSMLQLWARKLEVMHFTRLFLIRFLKASSTECHGLCE